MDDEAANTCLHQPEDLKQSENDVDVAACPRISKSLRGSEPPSVTSQDNLPDSIAATDTNKKRPASNQHTGGANKKRRVSTRRTTEPRATRARINRPMTFAEEMLLVLLKGMDPATDWKGVLVDILQRQAVGEFEDAWAAVMALKNRNGVQMFVEK